MDAIVLPQSKNSSAPALSSASPSAAMSNVLSNSMPMLECVRVIRDTMFAESEAIRRTASDSSTAAVEAAHRIANCRGSVVLTGVGKAGWIAQKLVATLASTGSPAHFLHPSEAVHGDLGRVRADDLVIAFSNSGRSEEVVRVCGYLQKQAAGLIAITATTHNPLADIADHVVPIGIHSEACPNGLAPTTSTTVMLALGDAIAMLASKLRGFAAEDFARFHPGGAIGRQLANVDDVMRPLDQCRISPDNVSIRNAIATKSLERRSGAVILVDSDGHLSGIFTDSDLVKLLQRREEFNLDCSISEAMTKQPVCIQSGEALGKAVEILSKRHLSELPVIDQQGYPLGMIDITDLIAAGDVRTGSRSTESKSSQATSDETPAVVRFPNHRSKDQ